MKRSIEGYAAVFNSESEDMGFIEIIHPQAITQDTINNSDIFALFNHDDDRVLARSKNGVGTLSLKVDGRGLKYSFEAPNTTMGNDLLELVANGVIDKSSFAFTVPQGGDDWEVKDDKLVRHIFKINRLYDVSPVLTPAYKATSCASSDYDEEEMKKMLEEIDSM